MKKAIVVILLLGFVFEYIGDWDNFLLRGTGYRLVNHAPDHIYLLDVDRNLAVGHQIVDIESKKTLFLS